MNKIEILLEKIDKAIAFITQLKEERTILIKKNYELEEKMKKLEEENLTLKKLNEVKEKEIERINESYKEIEVKLDELLNFLDEEIRISSNEQKESDNKFVDEEMTNDFIQERELKEEFFNIKETTSKNDEKKIDHDDNLNLFMFDEGNKEINFYLDEDYKEKEEFPHGIL